MSDLHREKIGCQFRKTLEDSRSQHLKGGTHLSLGRGRRLWGYKPIYPHGSTWAAPSEVARPTR